MKLKSILTFLLPFVIVSCQKRELATPQNATNTSDSAQFAKNGNFYFPKDYTPGKLVKVRYYGKDSYVEQRADGYLLEGDIRLSNEQLNLLNSGTQTNGRAATAEFTKLWPGGVVPFIINGSTNAADINRINAAISSWMSNTPLVFVPWNGQTDFVEFLPATENSSHVGRIGGHQIIRFVPNNFFEGPIIHEIGHAIGLFHEQSRSDREAFITINWSNIRPGMSHNFSKYGFTFGFDIGTFDFNSIMLYPSVIDDPAFVFNTTIPTITRNDGSQYTSNPFDLSVGDIETANYLYSNQFTKVYARIEYSNIQIVDHGWERTESGDAFLKFYSNAACTVPTFADPGVGYSYYSVLESIPAQGGAGLNYEQFNIHVPNTSTSQISLGRQTYLTEYPFIDDYGYPAKDVYKLTFIMSNGVHYFNQGTYFDY